MAEQVMKAPMRARVVRFHVQKGGAVKAKDRVCDIEAMKMEIVVSAPAAGTIKEIHVTAGQQVEAGAPLFTIES